MARPQKRWKLLDETVVKNKEELINILIKNRGIKEEQIDEFLNPKHPSEYDLLDEEISLAKKIILDAIENSNPIIIHGDYDADGQTATAILWRTIHNDLGYKNVFCYIPNRFDEGYGLSEESIQGMETLLASKGFQINQALIVTVDCGITSHKEVEIAKKHGFKVIISDHHQKGDNLPTPDALVWTDKSVGAGISWLISNALISSLYGDNYLNDKYLDLACIGTVCDLQPLIGFNRSIVKYGLEKLNSTPNMGIKILSDLSDIKDKYDTYHLGWIIGPKLNATGRLESAMDSLNLLLADSNEEALTYAQKLTDLNKQRQDKTKIDYELALFSSGSDPREKFLITCSETYHEGVIGLVAGKLVQTYHHPALAIVIDKESGMAKGSARSIEGISIVQTLRRFEHLFEKLGGHDMAAGFSLKVENIPILQEELNKLDSWPPETFSPIVKIDAEIDTSLLTIETYESIQKLKPFGTANPEPTLSIRSMNLFNFSLMGKENNHMKLFLVDKSGYRFNAIWFSATDSESSKSLKIGEKIDVAFTMSLNEWNGRKTVEMKVKDAKMSEQ